MGEALFWGLLACSSLVLGGLVGIHVRMPPQWIGVIMAFGAGVLISAAAYEPFELGGKLAGLATTLGFALAFAVPERE
jgi:zinc transporter, ZIP family